MKKLTWLKFLNDRCFRYQTLKENKNTDLAFSSFLRDFYVRRLLRAFLAYIV